MDGEKVRELRESAGGASTGNSAGPSQAWVKMHMSLAERLRLGVGWAQGHKPMFLVVFNFSICWSVKIVSRHYKFIQVRRKLISPHKRLMAYKSHDLQD